MATKTQGPEYQVAMDVEESQGFARLGHLINQTYHHDPRRLAFVLARYKFVAKMLSGAESVLEIGCGDAFASRLVQQEVGTYTAIDREQSFVDDVQSRINADWPMTVSRHDILLDGPVTGTFDAAFSLDVLEHILPKDEDTYVRNCIANLTPQGVFIVGSPSLPSQVHASAASRIGHVNCKEGDDLKALMRKYFHNVFVFSMNDEVVHTGFYGMAHYYFALCCGKR